MSTRESRFEEIEVYRTALEFRRIASRIEDRLPLRKLKMKQALSSASAAILEAIEQAAAAGVGEASTPHAAQAPLSTCHHILDQLSMIRMGGKADVTAGLEILERVLEMLGCEKEERY
jgi:LPS O-antigen subunit length determinant protein (WzzB/FepE family)